MKNKDRPFTDIDLSRLEVECMKQPRRLKKHTDLLAEANKDVAEAKANLEVVEADVKRAIRRNPNKYDIHKITEGAVSEAMVISKRYREAKWAVIEAEHTVDVLKGSVKSLDHRKGMIEGAITLHGQGYFSKPRIRQNDEFDLTTKRIKRGGGVKRKKR